MLTNEMILSMLAWPALAAAAVLALAWVPPVARSRAAAALIAPLAVAVGFAVGYAVVVGAPELVPALDAKARLPHVAALALAMAAASVWSRRRAVVWTAFGLGSLVATRLVLAAAIEFQWTVAGAVARVLVLAAAMAATALLARRFAGRVPPRTAAVGLAALGGVAAPLMLFSDSLLLAQLHGTLGVAVGVTAVAVWLAPGRVPIKAAAPVVVALAFAHWMIALLFANMPVTSFALLVVAPPAAVVVSRTVERWRPRRHAVAALVCLGALVVGSVALGGVRYARTTAASDQAAESPAAGDYGYGYGYDQ